MDGECTFCKIAMGILPSYKIYEDNDIMAVLDIFPSSKGDILIFPKNHYTNPEEIPDEIIGKIFVLSKYLSYVVKNLFKYPGITLIANFGNIGRSNHFYVNIVPRYDGDNVKIIIPKKQTNTSELEEVRSLIINNFSINREEKKEERKEEKKEEKKIDYSKLEEWFKKRI